jgi:hypothetical protein
MEPSISQKRSLRQTRPYFSSDAEIVAKLASERSRRDTSFQRSNCKCMAKLASQFDQTYLLFTPGAFSRRAFSHNLA